MPKKKAIYKSASDKAIGLFALLLFRGGWYSLARLSHTLDCSKQTVLRALQTVQQSHYIQLQIRKRGRQHEYSAATPRNVPRVALTPEAIQQLLLCRDLVCHMLPPALEQEVTASIEKTTTLLPQFEARAGALDSFAQAVPRGGIDYAPVADLIDTLFKGMRTRRVCRVTYQAPGKAKPKEYDIGPCRFVAIRDTLYVVARLVPKPGDRAYDDPLVLAAHRFNEVTLTQRTFDPLPESAMPGFEAFGFAFEPPFKVKVRFSPKAAPYVAERTWSRDQRITRRRDGSIDLTFSATNREEVISWVLSFGPEAELLEPEGVRREVGKALSSASLRYALEKQAPNR